MNKYKWEGINFPSEKEDGKKAHKNIVTIALKVLYAKKKKICLAYISKHKSDREIKLFI